MTLAGVTDSNGYIQCVSAAESSAPGSNGTAGNDGDPLSEDCGVTDDNGNLLIKAYA